MTMTPAIEVCHTVKPLAPRLGLFGMIALLAGCSGSPTSGDPAPTALNSTALVSLVPSAGASEVTLMTDIEVRFNGTIPTTVRSCVALHVGECPDPVVEGMWSRSADGPGFGSAPFQPLIASTDYTIHVGGGMTDHSGEHFDLAGHGLGLGGEWVTEETVRGPDRTGMGTDMMGQTITHSGLGWANPDGTYGMAFPFSTGR
jgi:hypothetical protein